MTPNNSRTLGTSPASYGTASPGKMTSSPTPGRIPHTFVPEMFLLDTNAPNPVSQPLRPALPNPPSRGTHSRPMNGLSARSPSAYNTVASPADSGATPDSHTSYSSNNYLDPRSSASPYSQDTMNGISGNTTPGYEVLEEVSGGVLDLSVLSERVNSLPTLNIPDHEPQEDVGFGIPPNSAGSSGYPPSPRLTASPSPAHTSPKATTSGSSYNSPIVVKLEPSTPTDRRSVSSDMAEEDHRAIRRDEDGSWQGGIHPSERGAEYLPFSIKDLEFERLKQEKNAEVEEWLRVSAQQLPRQPIAGGLAAPKDGRRRSRSVSDFRASQAFINGKPVGPPINGESCANGIGIVIDDDAGDDDDSSVASVDSAWKEGSLDEHLQSDAMKELPPSNTDLKMTETDEDRLQRERENDPALFPKPRQFFRAHPWDDLRDPILRGATMVHRNQPSTSNVAIMKFKRCADNIETASRVATFGSNMTKGRRNSAGDADQILPGPLKRLSFGRDKDKDKNKNGATPTRRPSIWGGFRSGLKRNLSNAGDKDKDKDKDKNGSSEKENGEKKDNNRLQSPVEPKRKRGRSFSGLNSSSPFAQGILGPTFSPPLRVQTTNVGSALMQMASPLMAPGAGANQPPTSPPTSTSSVSSVVNRIRRHRSRSDLQRKHIFGVVTSLVGPALPGVASPAASASASPPEKDVTPGIEKKFTFGEESQRRGVEGAKKLLSPNDARRDDEDEEMDDFSPQTARTPGGTKAALPKHEIIPTLDGFAQNVRVLAPGLSPKLVDRIAHEQVKRFKKLVDHRHKHLAALNAQGHCSNGQKCRKVFGAIGVGSDGVVGVTGHKRGASTDHDFDSSDEHDGPPGDGNVAAAQFPPGVPTPPVSRLPAEFECPICFKTKKFNKPSDWTKHVHEDVQPFTCTFPECTEPKSFKRKADWVRHENERHRHLEWWTCNQPDCTHTCYRKDNFVQHLVREHKMPEPKVKTQKRNGAKDSLRADLDRVWHIVEVCHQETSAHPNREKCRFCGLSCSTWKKLTVHLARHMEAISLPVLDLIKDDAVVPPTTRPRRNIPAAAAPQPAPPPPPPPPPPAVTMSMDIDHFPVVAHESLQPQLPTYNLTPPTAQHHRSRSVPGCIPPQQYLQQPTTYNNLQYPVQQQQQQQQPYRRSPQPQQQQQQQQQQVYSHDGGFDGGGGGYHFFSPAQPVYSDFAQTPTLSQSSASPMLGAYMSFQEEMVDGYPYAMSGVSNM